jgi:hypothetical protein
VPADRQLVDELFAEHRLEASFSVAGAWFRVVNGCLAAAVLTCINLGDLVQKSPIAGVKMKRLRKVLPIAPAQAQQFLDESSQLALYTHPCACLICSTWLVFAQAQTTSHENRLRQRCPAAC